jgi:tetratricopeptide (TPR) repeat protein
VDQSIAEYRVAIRIEPNRAWNHMVLAWALVLRAKRPRRDYDEGLVHARKAVELAPKDGDAVAALALAEYRSGHWAESLAAIEQSLTMENGGDASNWFVLALARREKGDKNQARTWFDKAVVWTRQNAPEDPELHQLWTEAAELLGQPGPAATGAVPASEKPR